MSVTDYVIDILLILVILVQVRPHELTPRAALLPLVLLAVAGIVYLRPFTLRGNDLAHPHPDRRRHRPRRAQRPGRPHLVGRAETANVPGGRHLGHHVGGGHGVPVLVRLLRLSLWRSCRSVSRSVTTSAALISGRPRWS